MKKRKISIFAKWSYLGNAYPKHTKELNTHRLSSRIRGNEIAEYAGFQLNPRRGPDNGVRIWVKPTGLGHIKDGDYVDVLDGLHRGRHELLKDRPKINVIAASENSYDVLRAELPNKMVLIPHHHLNFERAKRTKRKVNTCGYIGSPSPRAFRIYNKIRKRLGGAEFKFISVFNYKTREDAINFYKKIDILVVGAWRLGDTNPHKIPTKLINAASFGIPSVAFPLGGYKELEGNYVRASNMDELVRGVEMFKDKDVYNEWSNRMILMAEKYHIENVAKLYRKLE